MESFIERLRAECGYDPEADGSVDDLIGYKDALEDLVAEVDSLMVCNSGTAAAARERARRREIAFADGFDWQDHAPAVAWQNALRAEAAARGIVYRSDRERGV